MIFKLTAASHIFERNEGELLKRDYENELKNFSVNYNKKCGEIKIETIEDLIHLMEETNRELIISLKTYDDNYERSIIIYDDYVE